MKYGTCKFPDSTVKIVKIVESNNTHTLVEYGMDQLVSSNATTCWVHNNWITPWELVQDDKKITTSMLVEIKEEELHFVNQIIKNLNYLGRLYKLGPLEHKIDANVIDHHLKAWCDRQWELTEEINDLKGYPHYEPEA